MSFKYIMAPWYRRLLHDWWGVPLPEVMIPEYIILRYSDWMQDEELFKQTIDEADG